MCLKISKGVIVSILPDDDMPVDADGVRAEIIMDQAGRMNRMIPGSLYEHYIGSCCVKTRIRMGEIFGVQVYPEPSMDERNRNLRKERSAELFELAQEADAEAIEAAWVELYRLYSIFAPLQAKAYRNADLVMKREIVAHAFAEMPRLLMPTNNPIWVPAAILHAEHEIAPTYGPVQYRGNSTRLSTTRRPARIAPVAYIMLDKVADSGSAVSSGRLQIHGVLTHTTTTEKHSSPVKQNSTRLTGEGEIRIINSTCDPETAPELLDRNANPQTHEAILRGLMTSPVPTDVESLVDRKQHPLGYARPLQIFRHFARCAGWELKWIPHRNTISKPSDSD